jgi:hypothetical protein
MCEILNLLILSLGGILKSAIGIALGTTLATGLTWILFIGPILRDNLEFSTGAIRECLSL